MKNNYSVSITLEHEIPKNNGQALAVIKLYMVQSDAESAIDAMNKAVIFIKTSYNIINGANNNLTVTHIDIIPSNKG